MTAQLLVYAWSDNRRKDGIILDQEVHLISTRNRAEGAESLARQVTELLNRYGMALRHPIR